MSESTSSEEWLCPLCMEEMDLTDRHFKPCSCGYQVKLILNIEKICSFCWNHICQSLNGKCPACRKLYHEQEVEFTPIPEELLSRKKEKKKKENSSEPEKSTGSVNKKHLEHLRVIQKNLVYVIGLSTRVASEEILKQAEYFGQFGKIIKVVVNRKQVFSGTSTAGPSVSVYVTFAKKRDAALAIHTIDGSILDGRILRASFGTTKYCSFFLKNQTCPNPGCMYLHEQGEMCDSFTKEEMT
ncbi:hypothetical protein ROZALSC1DRAFT_18185, partial [Rozella allomycis CSF55]